MEDFGPLPERYAEIYNLRQKGETVAYIAEYIGISPRTVRERLNRSRLHLEGRRRATEYHESAKPVTLFETSDLTPCPRCFLRGAHDACLGRAEDYLGNREEPNF